jgi:hypothetical protein
MTKSYTPPTQEEFDWYRNNTIMFLVFESWSHDNTGYSHGLFTNRQAAKECLQSLIEHDKSGGITKYMDEEPDEWAVTSEPDHYYANEINGDKWIEIEIKELDVHSIVTPDLIKNISLDIR